METFFRSSQKNVKQLTIMNMKRFFLILFALATLAVSFVSCQPQPDDNPVEENHQGTTNTPKVDPF